MLGGSFWQMSGPGTYPSAYPTDMSHYVAKALHAHLFQEVASRHSQNLWILWSTMNTFEARSD